MAKDDTKKTPADTDAEAKAAEEAKAKAKADADAEAEAEAKADAEAKAKSTKGLVRVHKNGETLYVHPTTVAAHEGAGWKAV